MNVSPLLVRGRWVVTGAGPDDQCLSDAAVLVEGGRVAAIGPWITLRQRHPACEVLGSGDTVVLPGMINAHHHSSGVTALQQGIGDDLLEPWILAHARMRPSDAYLDTLLSAARLMATGVTAVVDVKSGGGRAEAYDRMVRDGLRAHDEAGLRVAYAAGISDQSFLVAGRGEDRKFLAALPEDVRRLAESLMPGPDRLTQDEYFSLMEAIWRDHREHPRIDLWFGPPGPQWVSDPFMQRIAERATALDIGIQTHVNESLYEKLHGPRFYGKATMLHLRDLGVLSPRFSIAHGVWLTEPEIAVMAETGVAVSHNPSSNLRLRAGIAPLNALRASGATVALGMDGTSLSDDEDMFAEMRLALRLARVPQLGASVPDPVEVLALATLGGAKLLRQEARLGRLAPGFAADLAVVDLARLSWPWVAPECDPLELVLMRARAGDVTTVLVDGEVIYRDRQPTGFDLAAAAEELAARLAHTAYSRQQAELVRRLTPHIEAYYRGWEVPEMAPYIRYNARG